MTGSEFILIAARTMSWGFKVLRAFVDHGDRPFKFKPEELSDSDLEKITTFFNG